MKKIIVNFVLLLVFSCSLSLAQNRVVSGLVIDETGQPMPGVSVFVKGTSQGVVSGHDGTFSIEVRPGDQVLVFAFIGYQTHEAEIGNRRQINVQLFPAIASLEEVVVTGYGTTLRRRGRDASRVGAIVVDAEMSPNVMYAPVMVHDPGFNTESYSTVHETGFKDTRLNPLSTFSIDVDNASYSNIRRFINSGSLPPQDAVRIEEMLNYFAYSYPEPEGEHPFGIHTELSQCPWNPQTQLLHVGLQARNIDKSELPPSNLVFLIDVSGSMRPANRLPLVKTAMNMLVEELRPTDKVSIVVYAGQTRVVLESTPARHKQRILDAIASLQAAGGTAGGQALRMAYEVAERNFIEGGNNRIILCTDGDFNLGESSNAAMERLVERERQKGIFITVLGFGMGNYKDDRLEIIANKGNGNYAYIDNIQEARKVLVSEFAGTLFTLAKDVKLQIEFNPARVQAYRLIGYENRRLNNEDFNDDTKDAGEMGAGHSVTALYEIIPAGASVPIPGVDPLRYQSNPEPVRPNASAELLTVKARYKAPDSDRSVMFDLPVRGRVVPLHRTSADFRFAAAVAEFGLLLRHSPYKAQASWESILERALAAKGEDHEGYRAEFINLVRTAQNLERLSSGK